MSTVTPSYWKSKQGVSWTTSANPVVMGHNQPSFYIQGALYSVTVQVTANYRIDSITINVGKICSNKAYAYTNVYVLMYNSDPTNSFTNYAAPTATYSGYATPYINGSVGTDNISVTVPTSITTSGTYYFFITTDATNSLDPYKSGTAISITSITDTALVKPGAWIKIGGVWKFATVWIKIGGVWKVAEPWIKISGTWKKSQS